MSATTAAAVVGMGVSIYGASQSGKAGDTAQAAEMGAYGANTGIANELRARQIGLVDKPLEAKIAELQGSKITAAGQQGMDRFNYEMGNADRAIQEQAPIAGEGVTGSRELSQQFRKAQGVAGINIQDKVNKNAELGNYLNLAQQTPGWAQIGANANINTGNAYQNQAMMGYGNEASSYATAAKGLSTLADMYATNHPDTQTQSPDVRVSGSALPAQGDSADVTPYYPPAS